jgi:predicted regulator of Ras-like GTPase activity (Roadblock/LC7/MglB family)
VSDFRTILQSLVERVPGAVGAIFADWEGEAIGEFAFDMQQLDIRIFGAQWGVVWNQLRQSLGRSRLGTPVQLLVDGANGAVLVHQVADDYNLVLSLRRGSHLATALREVARGVETLRAEM